MAATLAPISSLLLASTAGTSSGECLSACEHGAEEMSSKLRQHGACCHYWSPAQQTAAMPLSANPGQSHKPTQYTKQANPARPGRPLQPHLVAVLGMVPVHVAHAAHVVVDLRSVGGRHEGLDGRELAGGDASDVASAGVAAFQPRLCGCDLGLGWLAQAHAGRAHQREGHHSLGGEDQQGRGLLEGADGGAQVAGERDVGRRPGPCG